MTRCCIVKNCKAVKSADIILYNFPTDVERCRQWCQNLKIDNDVLNSKSRVCNKHFDPSLIRTKYLKRTAVPTLHLGHEDDVVLPPLYVYKHVRRKCCIAGCLATAPPTTLFRFPIDEERQRQWAAACGVEKVATAKLFVCNQHFAGTPKRLCKDSTPQIMVPSTKSLSSPSSPSYSTDLAEAEPEPDPEPESEPESDIDNIDMPTCNSCVRYAKSQNFLKKKYETCQVEVKRQKEEYDAVINCLNRKIQQLEEEVRLWKSRVEKKCSDMKVYENVDEHTKEFAKSICSSERNINSEKQRQVLQNICYTPTKAYKSKRKTLKFNLPSSTKFYRCPIKKLQPGINVSVSENLKKLASSFPTHQGRDALLVMDEMDGRAELEYDAKEDKVDGFADFSNGDRSPGIATKFLFFMLKGLSGNWKTIISFYASASVMSGLTTALMLVENINCATDCGFKIRGIICNQRQNNITAVSHLKAHPDDNYILNNNRKIYIFFDYYHLFKNFRNMLLKYDVQSTDGKISWSVIKAVYTIDCRANSRKLMPKITEKHVNPKHFEKMKVSYATQIFSNTVAAAIEFCSKNKLFDDQEVESCAYPTLQFIRQMNTAFDVLSCKRFGLSNHDKQPITRRNEQLKKLSSIKSYLSNLELPSTRIISIKEMIHTIDGLSELCSDVFKDGYDFMLPGRISQDCLENTFNILRSKLDNNVNPSLREIQILTAKLLSMKIITGQFNGSNCIPDDDENIEWNSNTTCAIEVIDDESRASAACSTEADTEDFVIDEENPASSSLICLKASRYFLGHGIHKLCCDKCNLIATAVLKEIDSSEHFIKLKGYNDKDCFNNPTDEMFAICNMCIEICNVFFAKHKHEQKLRARILALCEAKIVKKNAAFLDGECRQHKLVIIEHLIKVLLYKSSRSHLKEMQLLKKKQTKDTKWKKFIQ